MQQVKAQTSRSPNFIFVYGTLRRGSRNSAYRVLSKNASFVSSGIVTGSLYNLGNYPGMTVTKRRGDRVIGEIYSIPPKNVARVFRTLDNYEGLGPNDPRPHEYVRRRVKVIVPEDKAIYAWAYVLNKKANTMTKIRSGDYHAWRQNKKKKPELT